MAKAWGQGAGLGAGQGAGLGAGQGAGLGAGQGAGQGGGRVRKTHPAAYGWPPDAKE